MIILTINCQNDIMFLGDNMRKIRLGDKDKSLKYDFRETCFGIYKKGNQMLVTFDKKYNQYSLIGGGIEPGEKKHDTLRREFLEEVGIKIKGKGGVSVEKTASKNTIVLKKANSELAVFTVSPSNNNEDVMIEDIVLSVQNLSGWAYLTWKDIRVKFDGVEQYEPTESWNKLTYSINETINGKVTVSIALKSEQAGKFEAKVYSINDNKTVRTYNKYFVPAVVLLTKQEDLDGTTKFTYEVTDKSDSDYTISDFCIYATTGDADAKTNALWCKDGDIEGDNMFFEVKWATSGVTFVKGASYIVDIDNVPTEVTVDYDNYSDYFKINGADARVYKVKN